MEFFRGPSALVPPAFVTALAVVWSGWVGTPPAQAGDAVLVGRRRHRLVPVVG